MVRRLGAHSLIYSKLDLAENCLFYHYIHCSLSYFNLVVELDEGMEVLERCAPARVVDGGNSTSSHE